MHDLLLFGQIPESRFSQLLEILAGLTALPDPKSILERRYIFRPNRKPTQKIEQLGGSQNITDVHKLARRLKAEEESRYCTLIEDLTLDDQPDGTRKQSGADDVAPTKSAFSRPRYTLQVSDVPEPEIKSVMSLARTVTTITSDDAIASVESQGQIFVHQFVIEGNQFVFNNIVIRLQRCMQLVPIHPEASGPRIPMSGYTLSPWDKSGGYMLQASVSIADGKNPELVSRGTEELRRLKEDLRGCVDLRTVERLSMDPRVK